MGGEGEGEFVGIRLEISESYCLGRSCGRVGLLIGRVSCWGGRMGRVGLFIKSGVFLKISVVVV